MINYTRLKLHEVLGEAESADGDRVTSCENKLKSPAYSGGVLLCRQPTKFFFARQDGVRCNDNIGDYDNQLRN